MMGTVDGLLLGLQTALSPSMLLYCFIGVFLGTFVGVLPGIGALAAISLILPVTFHLPATEAIVMLAGVFYGAQYGGKTASILLNLPGTPTAVVTCLDGHPMAQQGRAGVALFMTTVASFVGSMIGIVLLMMFSPAIARLGLKFGPSEYFSLMLLGLVAASTMTSGSAMKGYAMVVLGLLLGTIGRDVNSGIARFSFGLPDLMEGINLVALAMGIFGISEVINSVNRIKGSRIKEKITMRRMLPKAKDVKDSVLPILRGTGVGGFFGALPGTGGDIASFVSYAVEKRIARDPGRFGKGAIEGVTAPEAANNAAAQTAFVPTLSLGVPGDAVMALMIGALIIQGIQPGPLLITTQPELFWGLVVSFGIGNIMLVLLNIPLIGLWVSMLRIPYGILYPAILVFISLGVYSVHSSAFDIFVTAIMGVAGYFLIAFRFNCAPILLGFVLGPLMEENLRRALILSRGDMMTFVQRPISGTILALCAALLAFSAYRALRGSRSR